MIGTNPKDLLGVRKVSLTKLPPTALAHAGFAMMNGAEKYGPYNWRDKPVIASIYVDAAERHLNAWFDGEEDAADSGARHLGHAMACLAILLDAQESGNLVDDRPAAGRGTFCRVLEQLNAKIAAKNATVGDVLAHVAPVPEVAIEAEVDRQARNAASVRAKGAARFQGTVRGPAPAAGSHVARKR
jgi:hypothetical protein